VTRSTHLLVYVAGVGALLPLHRVPGQTPTARPLSPTSAVVDFRGPPIFGRVRGVRELSGGALLVTDAAERALFLFRPGNTRARQLGRTGDGPGEYRNPSRLIKLGGDSTLVLDANNRRWYLLDGDRFVVLPQALRDVSLRIRTEPNGIGPGETVLETVGIGARRTLPIPFPSGSPELYDSVAFVRHHSDQSVDTIGKGRTYFHEAVRKRALINGAAEVHQTVHPLQSSDQAVMFSSGAVAIVRVNPYGVDWWDESTRRWTTRVAPREAPRPLTSRLKQGIASSHAKDASGKSIYSATDFRRWPAMLPPFTNRSVIAGADGRLYVLRTRESDLDARLVDVFDRTGRVLQFALPVGARFLSVGDRGVYIASKDEDDLESLVRLRLPRVRN
jgi:hypothetical protein